VRSGPDRISRLPAGYLVAPSNQTSDCEELSRSPYTRWPHIGEDLLPPTTRNRIIPSPQTRQKSSRIKSILHTLLQSPLAFQHLHNRLIILVSTSLLSHQRLDDVHLDTVTLQHLLSSLVPPSTRFNFLQTLDHRLLRFHRRHLNLLPQQPCLEHQINLFSMSTTLRSC
jgi:hypothetical protein